MQLPAELGLHRLGSLSQANAPINFNCLLCSLQDRILLCWRALPSRGICSGRGFSAHAYADQRECSHCVRASAHTFFGCRPTPATLCGHAALLHSPWLGLPGCHVAMQTGGMHGWSFGEQCLLPQPCCFLHAVPSSWCELLESGAAVRAAFRLPASVIPSGLHSICTHVTARPLQHLRSALVFLCLFKSKPWLPAVVRATGGPRCRRLGARYRRPALTDDAAATGAPRWCRRQPVACATGARAGACNRGLRTPGAAAPQAACAQHLLFLSTFRAAATGAPLWCRRRPVACATGARARACYRGTSTPGAAAPHLPALLVPFKVPIPSNFSQDLTVICLAAAAILGNCSAGDSASADCWLMSAGYCQDACSVGCASRGVASSPSALPLVRAATCTVPTAAFLVMLPCSS